MIIIIIIFNSINNVKYETSSNQTFIWYVYK